MTVVCQQQEAQLIRQQVPGHGPQQVQARVTLTNGLFPTDHLRLACGCSLPVRFLSNVERAVLEHP